MRNKTMMPTILIIIGVLGLIAGAFALWQYGQIKAALIDEASPDTVWSLFGNVFAFAAVGSNMLAIGLIALTTGTILILIGMCMRR
jgi:hypothetical protein